MQQRSAATVIKWQSHTKIFRMSEQIVIEYI